MIATEDTGYNFFLKPNQFEGFQDVLARPFLAAKVPIISQGPYQRKPPSHHHKSKAPASVESRKEWWRHYRWEKKWQTYDKHTTNIQIQHHATNGSGYVVGLCVAWNGYIGYIQTIRCHWGIPEFQTMGWKATPKHNYLTISEEYRAPTSPIFVFSISPIRPQKGSCEFHVILNLFAFRFIQFQVSIKQADVTSSKLVKGIVWRWSGIPGCVRLPNDHKNGMICCNKTTSGS